MNSFLFIISITFLDNSLVEALEKRIMPAMNINTRNPNPIRQNDEVNKFKELQENFDKLFQGVFGIIAFKGTNVGETLFTTHPNVMMVMVLMIVLYFLVRLLGIMLQERCFMIILVLIIMLVIASVSSVLVLYIISPHIAWFTSLLWVGIFAVIGYYSFQEFYKLTVFAVSDTTQIWCEFYKRQSTQFPV